MRILSLNAWGGRVYDPLIPYLKTAAPDVLCLQEIVHTPAADREWLLYRDGALELPQRANLFSEVAGGFPSHYAFFCPAARGDLFDGGRKVASEWGLATFVRRDHPVIGQAQDFIHGAFSADGWGSHPRARNAHAVRLFDNEGSSTMTVVHLHGLRDPSGKHDTPARQVQTQSLISLINSIWRRNERLVVCGDFNVLPGSAMLEALRSLGLTELVTSRGHPGTRTSLYKKPERFADYMLVSENVKVRRFEVVRDPEVSDHCALVLDVH